MKKLDTLNSGQEHIAIAVLLDLAKSERLLDRRTMEYATQAMLSGMTIAACTEGCRIFQLFCAQLCKLFSKNLGTWRRETTVQNQLFLEIVALRRIRCNSSLMWYPPLPLMRESELDTERMRDKWGHSKNNS
mmetsp:Transcript_29581/g.60808  ORF Transcript_29581/g.60808 Transcript_29581/m.60808 type:complete len:132 (-) Transcript_29581:1361-1756(-)